MKKIAFLNDTSSWYHWGCTGTSEAIKSTLAERGYDVKSVPIQSIYACQPIPQTTQEFDSPEFFNSFFHANLPVTGPILQCDTVVINGEGSLHGLSQIARVLLYLAYASKLVCKKKVQIINHSCYPVAKAEDVGQSPIAAIYKGVYRHLDYVAVREHVSQEILKAMGVDAALAFDSLPLYIKQHGPVSTGNHLRSIVISGSVAWRPEGIAGLAAFMRSMAADGYSITLLTGARSYPAQDDVQFLKALRQQLPEGWEHIEAASMSEWLHTIQSAALLISGRFHYTIAACSLSTPCIVLDSNTPKNNAICKEAKMPEPLSYSDPHLAERLMERAKALLGTLPICESTRQGWLNRAAINFAMLPYLTD
ncbi:polysaccharide pyruvyl transferase family protein [Planctomicrobium sp. SH527]|uniref:polysaccharide pyruvyl transferase family protein n=1 Tax=Planctomicrobium sp. SH527 TaxID=3448123 RepID=UPI003F5B3F6E